MIDTIAQSDRREKQRSVKARRGTMHEEAMHETTSYDSHES